MFPAFLKGINLNTDGPYMEILRKNINEDVNKKRNAIFKQGSPTGLPGSGIGPYYNPNIDIFKYIHYELSIKIDTLFPLKEAEIKNKLLDDMIKFLSNGLTTDPHEIRLIYDNQRITPNFVLGQSIDYVLSRPKNFIKLYINLLLEEYLKYQNYLEVDSDEIWILENFIKFIGYTLFKICQNKKNDEENIKTLTMKSMPREIAELIVRHPRARCTQDEFALLKIFTDFMVVDLDTKTIGGKRRLKRKNTKRNKNKKRITKRKRGLLRG